MNTNQIDFVLRHSKLSNKYFIGVYSSDTIPDFQKKSQKYPISFVTNTDKAGQPGKHWVALFVTSPNKIEYFDSFGVWPPESKEIFNFLRRFKIISKNISKLQNSSENSCGPHSIYYVIKRSMGNSLDSIINELKRMHPFDDAYVKYHVYDLVYKRRNFYQFK